MEGLVECAVSRLDPQRGVKNQQWLANGVDDILSVVLNVLSLSIHNLTLMNQGCSFHIGQPSIFVNVITYKERSPNPGVTGEHKAIVSKAPIAG